MSKVLRGLLTFWLKRFDFLTFLNFFSGSQCVANASAIASDVHTLNANASGMRYASVFQYPKMAAILFPDSSLPYTSSRGQGLWERGLNCERKTPSWFEFSSCVCICLCVAMVHTCEMQTQAQMQAQGNLRNFLQFSVEWSLISQDFRHLARHNVVECCWVRNIFWQLDDGNRGKWEAIPRRTGGSLFFTTGKNRNLGI